MLHRRPGPDAVGLRLVQHELEVEADAVRLDLVVGGGRDLPDDPERRATTPHSWRLNSAMALDVVGLPSWVEADGRHFTAQAQDIGDAVRDEQWIARIGDQRRQVRIPVIAIG